jgi:hypothetical protein
VDDLQMFREGVAKEHGISLFRQYAEAEAAHYLRVDVSTLKRWRRAGKTPARNLGERQVRYLGLDIVDMIIFGDKWRDTRNESSKSESTGSPSAPEAPHGAAHGSTPRNGKPDAFLLARTTLAKRSKN